MKTKINMEDHSCFNIEVYNYRFRGFCPDNSYTGIDLGMRNDKIVKKIRFMPAYFNGFQMEGGRFQGSNESMGMGYEDLYIITDTPYNGWNEVNIKNSKLYRYIRYLGPPGSHCEVSRIEYYGISNRDSAFEKTREARLSGNPFGTSSEAALDTFNVPYQDVSPLISFRKGASISQIPICAVKSISQTVFSHHHDFIELMYIKSGACFQMLDNSISCLFPGDFMIIPPGKTHTYFGGSGLEVINVMVYSDMVPLIFKEHLNDLPGLWNFFSKHPSFCVNGQYTNKLRLNLTQQSEISSILLTMESDFAARAPGSLCSVFGLFLRLLFCLNRIMENLNQNVGNEQSATDKCKLMKGVMDYLNAHYTIVKNITDLAPMFNISYGRLASIFNEETGITISDYLNRLRIVDACEKILQGKESLTRIAYNTGFQSYSNFARVFKEYTDCSPLKLVNILGISS